MGVLKARVGGTWVPITQGFSSAQVGHVAYATTTTPQSIGASTTDITGATVTFTAIAGHRYLYLFKVGVTKDATASSIWIDLTTDANALVESYFHGTINANQRMPIHGWAIESPLAGSATRKLRMNINAGNVTAQGSNDRTALQVIDITQVQPADTSLVGAWTAPTFQNSWVNFGSGYQDAQYRKVGDIVYLRGWVKGGTANSIIFTLPAGFRPPAYQHFSCEANDKFGVLRVGPGGDVNMLIGDPANHVSLAGIQFSVST